MKVTMVAKLGSKEEKQVPLNSIRTMEIPLMIYTIKDKLFTIKFKLKEMNL